MGNQKWFRSKDFIILLLGTLGVALTAAAEEIVRRLKNGRKKVQRKRGEQTKGKKRRKA